MMKKTKHVVCLLSILVSYCIRTSLGVDNINAAVNMKSPVCSDGVCWNHNRDKINNSTKEIYIENELYSLHELFTNAPVHPLLSDNLLSQFDEYAIGLIIYNWWYIASMYDIYLGIACTHSLKQNNTLISSLFLMRKQEVYMMVNQLINIPCY